MWRELLDLKSGPLGTNGGEGEIEVEVGRYVTAFHEWYSGVDKADLIELLTVPVKGFLDTPQKSPRAHQFRRCIAASSVLPRFHVTGCMCRSDVEVHVAPIADDACASAPIQRELQPAGSKYRLNVLAYGYRVFDCRGRRFKDQCVPPQTPFNSRQG
jgi:hypothetical protein